MVTPDVSLVIPAYEEAESLPELTARIRAVCEGAGLTFEAWLIDDGSKDDTWGIIQRLAAEDGRIHGVRFRRNYGKSAAQAEVAQPGADANGLPPPIIETPAAGNDSAAPPTGTAAAPTAAPAPAASAPKPADVRYILQAGAFGGSGDAETVKAKIALLGLNARVESAKISGKTVYRVRMGPYASASELADAKAKLASSGLPAMAVRTN